MPSAKKLITTAVIVMVVIAIVFRVASVRSVVVGS